jgi:hypothetical protein
MKTLKELIERAEKAAGSQKELGLILGINPSNLRSAKAGQCGLPNKACYQIAELINEDVSLIIAASELVTEKKPDRVAFWKKKLHDLEKLAACVLVGVILNMSPTPAKAAPILQAIDSTVYIMSNAIADMECWKPSEQFSTAPAHPACNWLLIPHLHFDRLR